MQPYSDPTKMEDDLIKNKNGRQPQKRKDTLQKNNGRQAQKKNGRRTPPKKNKDDLKIKIK
jgi:hypothetical protein